MAIPNLTDLIAQNAPQYLGGVNPVGIIEPFNQYQRGALTTQAQGATPMGFMKGLQSAFQTQQAATPTAAQISGNFQQGRDLLTSGTRGVNQGDITSLMNPYINDVLNSTLSRINQEYENNASRLRGRTAAGQRSFGTTAQGVEQGILGKGLLDTIASTTANLNYGGYQSALDQFNKERARDLTGSQLATDTGFRGFGSLSDLIQNAVTGNVRNQANFATNVGNTLSAGDRIQQQNQRVLDVIRPEIEARRNFNLTNLAQLGDFLKAFPSSNVQNIQEPDMLSKLGGAALAGAGLMSGVDGAPTPVFKPKLKG